MDTIDHAMQISKKYQYRVRIVTLEGELFHPGGSLSGGTFKNNSNLLGRRKEQEALEKEKQTIESAIASVKEEIQTAQKQVENFVKDANAKAVSYTHLVSSFASLGITAGASTPNTIIPVSYTHL